MQLDLEKDEPSRVRQSRTFGFLSATDAMLHQSLMLSKARNDCFPCNSFHQHYHLFLVACRNLAANQILRQLAPKYAMPAGIWRLACSPFSKHFFFATILAYLFHSLHLACILDDGRALCETSALKNTWIEYSVSLGRY